MTTQESIDHLRELAQAAVDAQLANAPEHALDMWTTAADEEFIGEATPRTVRNIIDELAAARRERDAANAKLAKIAELLAQRQVVYPQIEDILNEKEAPHG